MSIPLGLSAAASTTDAAIKKKIYGSDIYENKPKLNGVYSRNNLPKTKGGAYAINLDEYESIGTHWIALYANDNNVTYFDSFGVEYITKEIRKFIENENIVSNIYRMRAYDSVIWGYFCIGFIDFMLNGKSSLEYTNIFSPNDKMIK